MKLIGITGGIGSGKSVVSRILRLQGYSVYDCDSRAKELMLSDSIKESLVSLLGGRVYDEKGGLDRKYLAGVIFSSEDIRRKVNGIVHTAVREDLCSWYVEKKSEGAVISFVESAILMTSEISGMPILDSIWSIEAPEEMRLSRVCRRNSVDPEEVRRRMESQRREEMLLEAEKSCGRVVVIINDGVHSLMSQIGDAVAK